MKNFLLILFTLFIANCAANLNAKSNEYIYGAAYTASDVGLYVVPAYTGLAFLGNKFMSAVHDNIPNTGSSILLKGCAAYVSLHLLRAYFKEKYEVSSGKNWD
jgi:hypothetical protein